MKRILFLILLGLLMNTTLAAGARFVRVEYEHSRRVQHGKITIELGSERNEDRIFYAKLNTADRRPDGFSPNMERVIDIDKEYFDTIYNKVLDLNFKDIIKGGENRVGADGVIMGLTAGTRQNYVKTTLHSPDFRPEERNTVEFCIIISELFSLVDMEEWL